MPPGLKSPRRSRRSWAWRPPVRGITHDELALPAPRPRFCALSNRKLAAAGVEMPHWRDAVARYARTLRRRTGTG